MGTCLCRIMRQYTRHIVYELGLWLMGLYRLEIGLPILQISTQLSIFSGTSKLGSIRCSQTSRQIN
jgi:hypothetical protein